MGRLRASKKKGDGHMQAMKSRFTARALYIDDVGQPKELAPLLYIGVKVVA
jgi:predicted RNA-binding protein